MFATVITDASFCHETKSAGWAAWVRIDGYPEPIKRYGEFKVTVESSSKAEILAALNGMYIAKQLGATRIYLQTDYIVAIHLIEGKVNKRGLVKFWSDGLTKAGLERMHIFGKHVRGHTRTNDARSYVNRWCDQKAKETMRKARA